MKKASQLRFEFLVPRAVFLQGVLLAAGASISASPATSADLEQLTACREKLERVQHSHRTGTAKLSFENAYPADLLARKAEDGALYVVALDGKFGIALTPQMLDTELRRMIRASRAPQRLRELFGALDDDPEAVEECLVRPILAERLLRERIAFSADVQKGAYGQARRIRELLKTETFSAAGGDYYRDVPLPDPRDADERETEVEEKRSSRVERSSMIARSDGKRSSDDIVDEDRKEAIFFTRRSEEAIEVIRIPKIPFSQWWERNRSGFREHLTETGLAAPRPSEGTRESLERFVALTESRGETAESKASNGADCQEEWDVTAPPPERFQHSAVWTGAEMIVWAGNSNGGYWRSGGVYEPATDTWRGMNWYDAPAYRQLHTAVWTGNEMIVWGGDGVPLDGSPSGALGSGGIYDPVSDSWTPTSSVDAPEPRFGHTAVWASDRMIIWGGRSDSSFWGSYDVFGNGKSYDPQTDTWADLPSEGVPAARHGHTAVWDGEGMIIWGGAGPDPNGNEEYLRSGARYDPDPQNPQWTELPLENAPTAREGHTAVWSPVDQVMIVWGGYGLTEDGYGEELATGGRYAPSAGWTPISLEGAPWPRDEHTAVWADSAGVMLVWGGEGRDGYIGNGGRYDPAADSWQPIEQNELVEPRIGHTAVWIGSEMVVWGGKTGSGWATRLLDNGGRYDPGTDAWGIVSTTGQPDSRSRHTAVWTGSEMIVWGGKLGKSKGGYATEEGGIYDPTTDSWRATTTRSPDAAGSPPPSPRYGHTAVWTGNRMIVWGGEDDGDTFDDGARYDPVADAWHSMTDKGAPEARQGHTAVWGDSAGRMIVWGGRASSWRELGDGALYDPQKDAWEPVEETGAPTPRFAHTATWAAKAEENGRMIVWGGWGERADGQDDKYLGDGAIFDPASPAGSRWTSIPDDGAPTPRAKHTAAWTGEEVLVWGGEDWENWWSFTVVADGAAFNPETSAWRELTTERQPAPRELHTAVWVGDEMVVWGGIDADESAFRNGGIYDPASDYWRDLRKDPRIYSRSHHTAVWADGIDRMLIWGGFPGYDPDGKNPLALLESYKPGCADLCNGVDDDGDGTVDEDQDGASECGVGECERSVADICIDGTLQACVPGDPVPEKPDNGKDDDCDGAVDEGSLVIHWIKVGRTAESDPACSDDDGELLPEPIFGEQVWVCTNIGNEGGGPSESFEVLLELCPSDVAGGECKCKSTKQNDGLDSGAAQTFSFVCSTDEVFDLRNGINNARVSIDEDNTPSNQVDEEPFSLAVRPILLVPGIMGSLLYAPPEVTQSSRAAEIKDHCSPDYQYPNLHTMWLQFDDDCFEQMSYEVRGGKYRWQHDPLEAEAPAMFPFGILDEDDHEFCSLGLGCFFGRHRFSKNFYGQFVHRLCSTELTALECEQPPTICHTHRVCSENSCIGRTERSVQLRKFAWNWSDDIARSSDQLVEAINELRRVSPDGKINIVAHSMGGLLVRHALIHRGNELEDENGTSVVDRVVYLGTPFRGSPSAMLPVLKGEFTLGIPTKTDDPDLCFSNPSVRNTARTMPGLYQLLPYGSPGSLAPRADASVKMSDILGIPVYRNQVLDRDAALPDVVETSRSGVWEQKCAFAELNEFRAEEFFRSLTYPGSRELKSVLEGREFTVVSKGVDTVERWDYGKVSVRKTTDSLCDGAADSRQLTVLRVENHPLWRRYWYWPTKKDEQGRGDGTVPTWSSTAVDGITDFDAGCVEHAELPNNECVIDQVVAILGHAEWTEGPLSDGEKTCGLDPKDAKCASPSKSQDAAGGGQVWFELNALPGLSVWVESPDGSRTGVIEGTVYREDDRVELSSWITGQVSALLPAEPGYRIHVTAEEEISDGLIDLTTRTTGEPVAAGKTISGFRLAPGEAAWIDVDGAELGGTALSIDRDGDGESDEQHDGFADLDTDGLADDVDLCPENRSTNEADLDTDGTPDACDPDADGDGVLNEEDNCPLEANPDQIDGDADGRGDPCDRCPDDPLDDTDRDGLCAPDDPCPEDPLDDADEDGLCGSIDPCPNDSSNADSDMDGVCDGVDNCASIANPDQFDTDADGIGNACDDDLDADDIPNEQDNCAVYANPSQDDLDADGTGDSCDTDVDGDGILNPVDNCPDIEDPLQRDFDSDGIGDVCESGSEAADVDNSGRVDGFDLARLGRAFGSISGEVRYDRTVDLNRDGWVDGLDLDSLGQQFGEPARVPQP